MEIKCIPLKKTAQKRRLISQGVGIALEQLITLLTFPKYYT